MALKQRARRKTGKGKAYLLKMTDGGQKQQWDDKDPESGGIRGQLVGQDYAYRVNNDGRYGLTVKGEDLLKYYIQTGTVVD